MKNYNFFLRDLGRRKKKSPFCATIEGHLALSYFCRKPFRPLRRRQQDSSHHMKGNHPHDRWRDVICHRIGIGPMVRADGAGEGKWGRSWGLALRPLLWIMLPSVRSAHCPLLDSLVSSVTMTHLLFILVLPLNSPVLNLPHPLTPAYHHH